MYLRCICDEMYLIVLVTLNLTTTGCEHNCVLYDGICPSSIKVNGKEMSPQKDGFNILVIDNVSGEMKTDFFRWFSRLSPFKWKDFYKYFKGINSSSTVIVVLQNMCKFFDKNWYTLLKDASDIKISHIPKNKYDAAILVGCKISCPDVILGSIPFNYYGHYDEFTETITFAIGSKLFLISYLFICYLSILFVYLLLSLSSPTQDNS